LDKKATKKSVKGDLGAERASEAYALGTFKGCETMTAKKAGWSKKSVNQMTEPEYRGKGA